MPLGLEYKAAHYQDEVQMASTLSNGVLRDLKHTPDKEYCHLNWRDRELQILTNSVEPSCMSSQ